MIKTCKTCSNKFQAIGKYAAKKFCSTKCRINYTPPLIKQCEECNKSYNAISEYQIWCSDCMEKWKKKKKNNNLLKMMHNEKDSS